MPESGLDVVGYWTEIKLSILRDYSKAYATILSQQRHIKHYSYIDGFAGISLLSTVKVVDIFGNDTMKIIEVTV